MAQIRRKQEGGYAHSPDWLNVKALLKTFGAFKVHISPIQSSHFGAQSSSAFTHVGAEILFSQDQQK